MTFIKLINKRIYEFQINRCFSAILVTPFKTETYSLFKIRDFNLTFQINTY